MAVLKPSGFLNPLPILFTSWIAALNLSAIALEYLLHKALATGKLEPAELVSHYVQAKTGLENPLLEIPLYLQLSLSDIKDWIDNYNNNKALELAKDIEWTREDLRVMFVKVFDNFVENWGGK